MYVSLQITIVPRIFLVIQKMFILLIWFILMFGGTHQTLVYLVLNDLSLLLMNVPMPNEFSSWKKNMKFLLYLSSFSVG